MNGDKLDLRPGGLEVLSAGLNLAELDLHGGEGLWDEVSRYVRESSLENQVDASIGGRPAPRVWALMESPGAGPSAAAAALGIARILADRGQAVVLVDVDENEPRLTRWLGRTELEGWIDMVRFGASLHSASDSLPSDNRRGSVMGVGSFAPTGVTPDEVAELLGRLRRQADDLVLVLPAKLRSQPWLEVAHIKLLCWDLLSRSTVDTEQIIAELDRMGARPDALLGFGVEEFSAIQDRLREIDQEDEPLLASDEPKTEPVTGPLVLDADTSETGVDQDEFESPRDEPSEEQVAADPALVQPTAEPEPVDATAAAEPAPPAASGDRRRSSGIFVFVAVVAVVCLVMLGVFLAGQRGGGATDPISPVATARMDSQSGAYLPASARSTETPTESTVEVAGAVVVNEPEADTVADPSDLPSAGNDGPPDTDQVSEILPEPVEPETTPAEAPTEISSRAESTAPAFDSTPFGKPVGEDGWTIWLSSCPQPAIAEREVRRLERYGIVAAYKAVEIEGKGTWYRVYTGSFTSRASAKAAVDGLKKKLKHDWAVPSRF